MTNPKISQISWADFWHSKNKGWSAPLNLILRRWKIGFWRWLQLTAWRTRRFMVMLSFTGEGRVIWQFASIMLSETIPQLKKDSQYCFSASVVFSRSIDWWDFYLCISDFRNPPPTSSVTYLTHSIFGLRSPSAPIWFRFLHCLRGWCSWCNLMKRHGDNNHRH